MLTRAPLPPARRPDQRPQELLRVGERRLLHPHLPRGFRFCVSGQIDKTFFQLIHFKIKNTNVLIKLILFKIKVQTFNSIYSFKDENLIQLKLQFSRTAVFKLELSILSKKSTLNHQNVKKKIIHRLAFL